MIGQYDKIELLSASQGDRLLRLCCLPIFGLISLLCFFQSPSDKPALNAPDTKQSASVAPNASLLGDANRLYRKGDFTKAIAKYKDVLQEKPASPDGWAGLIRSYLKAKNVTAAAQSAEQAIAVVDHPRTRTARAEVLFRQGEIVDAEKEWLNVVNSGYPEARAYLGLSRVRLANSMYRSAAKMIKKAHDFNPDDPDIKELWLTTLPLSQQVEQLKSLLAEETSLDEDQRTKLSSILDSAVEWRKDHGCRLVSKVNSMETPLVPALEYRRLRGYRVSVALNGRQEQLLLDTGASGIVVGRGVAAEAKITEFIPTRLGGIGGTGWTSGSIGFAESIKVGDMEFRNCPIKVTDDSSVVHEDGLIGSDVFENFLVEIDFPDEKLKLSELPKRPGDEQRELSLFSADSQPSQDEHMDENAALDRYIAPEMQSFTRVYRFGHLLLAATSIGDVPPKFFVLDSGAVGNLISPSAAEEVTKVRRRKDILVTGISGRVNDIYTAKKANIRFGHLAQQNQEIIAFDTAPQSDGAGIEISGFLGFQTLGMLDITIDYRDGLVNFSYDPKKWNAIKHRYH
jgi:tetratricopeptide (TPR) repeat protein